MLMYWADQVAIFICLVGVLYQHDIRLVVAILHLPQKSLAKFIGLAGGEWEVIGSATFCYLRCFPAGPHVRVVQPELRRAIRVLRPGISLKEAQDHDVPHPGHQIFKTSFCARGQKTFR